MAAAIDSERAAPAGSVWVPARSARRARSLGVVTLLTGALALLAVAPLGLPASYSWVEYGTRESAAQGVDGAWVARLGFILYGLAVVWLVRIRARAWGWPGAILHLAFGVGMFGVAAFAARSWDENAPYVESEELLHSVSASVVVFGFIGGVVAVMVARRLPSARAAVPDLVALAIAVVVPLMMSSSVWGILQRLMFLTAACWYAREAWLATSASGRPEKVAGNRWMSDHGVVRDGDRFAVGNARPAGEHRNPSVLNLRAACHGRAREGGQLAIAEFYRSLGMSELCQRAICDQDLRSAAHHGVILERTRTLSAGGARCDFRNRSLRRAGVESRSG